MFFSKTAYKSRVFRVWPDGANSPHRQGQTAAKTQGARSRFDRLFFTARGIRCLREADHIVQLHRPLPCSASSASRRMYFLGIPHRGNKAGRAASQNDQLAPCSGSSRHAALTFRGLAAGSLNQTMEKLQLFCLPGKVCVRAGRLFTKAGQIFPLPQR